MVVSFRGRGCSGVVSGPYGVSLRKHIRGGWGSFFSRFIRFEVGNGTRINYKARTWPIG